MIMPSPTYRLSACIVTATLILAASLNAQTANWFPSSGPVGIGTATPSGSFSADFVNSVRIKSASGNHNNSFLDSTDAGREVGFVFLAAGSPKWQLYKTSAQDLSFYNYVANRTQLHLSANGNVGLGTISPAYVIDVQKEQNAPTCFTVSNPGASGSSAAGFYATNNTNSGISVSVQSSYATSVGVLRPNYGSVGTDSAIDGLSLFTSKATAPIVFGPAGIEAMRIDANRNVGVGTITPSGPLHIYRAGQADIRLQTDGRHWAIVSNVSWGQNGFSIYDISADVPRVHVDVNGNVGIGTINPTQKLSVCGAIRAKEVIVETAGWSDYVLAKDYPLQPLSSVQQHIQREGHLPGIPSAQEVAEQGIGLGEMQARLLAKIEELTLHQIRQEQEIEKLKAKNAALEAKISGGIKADERMGIRQM
jgi:hypothetical protein